MRTCGAIGNWTSALLLAGGTCPAATEIAPYAVDAATLHLWHLDEAKPPFADAGLHPTTLRGLLNGAKPGQAALAGFGSSVSFALSPTGEAPSNRPYGPILLAQPALDIGLLDNVDPEFPVMGENGAFTMEAVVKLDLLPAASPGFAADIVSMDDDTAENRVFLFRIEKPGFLSFVPISGDAVRGGGLATIPTSGPHAINTSEWFHVAVTYDGNENVPNNLKLYWTRIGSGAAAANQIGRGTLTADLRRELGDFAIGNSGKINVLGPFEFFPGCIDEVRISNLARAPHDFFFVSPEEKQAAAQVPKNLSPPGPANLTLQRVFVDDAEVTQLPARSPLILGPGLHRLDFDFGFLADVVVDPLAVKCRLDGLDEVWQPTARGMTLTWEMLDENDNLLTRTAFSTTRSSPDWAGDVMDSPMQRRTEPLFVPEQARRIRLSMSSGPPDTTGCWVIDDIALTRSALPSSNLWANGDFGSGERLDQIGGIPSGWARSGTEPAIARVMLAEAPALGLLDAEQDHAGVWTCTQTLRVRPSPGGETFLVAWSEAFNVISGASLRATYMNVAAGHYTFRAIAVADAATSRTAQLAFPLVIRQPVWKQAWFLPAAVAAGGIAFSWGLFLNYRRRARHRIATIRMASALDRDRARIARDMHDDLGTRVSLLKHAASVVREAVDLNPSQAHHQAMRLESAASDLVWAMDGLVWAVNPANDSLEGLASHLAGVAQEIFRNTEVRLRISIPTDLPAIPLTSDFRHHYSLAVKESLHNILKHAGPCEVGLELRTEQRALIACVKDTGVGFDPTNPRAGNGLLNLATRAKEMHGTCEIESAIGRGTQVVLRCPLPDVPVCLIP